MVQFHEEMEARFSADTVEFFRDGVRVASHLRSSVPKPEPDEGRILLRLFFHPHGNKLLLLLCGYDKGRTTG